MITLAIRTSVALALGLALALAHAPAADAQNAKTADRVETTQGGHVTNRVRGRVGGYRGYRGYGGYGGGHRRGGGYIAGGLAAGIAGAIILNEATRSDRPSYSYNEGSGLSCGQLEARCDSGQEWACRRLDRDPVC